MQISFTHRFMVGSTVTPEAKVIARGLLRDVVCDGLYPPCR